MESAMTRLRNGQAFPAFDVPAVGGGTISIRKSLQGSCDGKILNAVYSSGPLGRLVAEDVIGMVAYLKSKAKVSAPRSRTANEAGARFPMVEPG